MFFWSFITCLEILYFLISTIFVYSEDRNAPTQTELVDDIWLMCCALHNMLFNVDGLDQPWDGIQMGIFGELEFKDMPLLMQ